MPWYYLSKAPQLHTSTNCNRLFSLTWFSKKARTQIRFATSRPHAVNRAERTFNKRENFCESLGSCQCQEIPAVSIFPRLLTYILWQALSASRNTLKPWRPSVATDNRKQFQCINTVFCDKTGPFLYNSIGAKARFSCFQKLASKVAWYRPFTLPESFTVGVLLNGTEGSWNHSGSFEKSIPLCKLQLNKTPPTTTTTKQDFYLVAQVLCVIFPHEWLEMCVVVD